MVIMLITLIMLGYSMAVWSTALWCHVVLCMCCTCETGCFICRRPQQLYCGRIWFLCTLILCI